MTEVIFSHGNYEETVRESDGNVRLIECSELGIVKLYRIEYKDSFGHDQHKVAYLLDGAIDLYTEACTKQERIEISVYQQASRNGCIKTYCMDCKPLGNSTRSTLVISGYDHFCDGCGKDFKDCRQEQATDSSPIDDTESRLALQEQQHIEDRQHFDMWGNYVDDDTLYWN